MAVIGQFDLFTEQPVVKVHEKVTDCTSVVSMKEIN